MHASNFIRISYWIDQLTQDFVTSQIFTEASVSQRGYGPAFVRQVLHTLNKMERAADFFRLWDSNLKSS